MMKYRILLCFLLMMFSSAHAFSQEAEQNIYIKSFSYEPMDRAAKDYPQKDGSGNYYALVKVRPASAAFTYSFGYMKHVVDPNKHEGETWIYVQKNAKWISISREGFKPIHHYDLGMTLEAGETYVLELSYVDPSSFIRKQWLKFDVYPHEEQATVMVKSENAENYEPWGTTDSNGLLARNLECGKYTYQIIAQDYVTSEGCVYLTSPNETLVEKVALVPNFGYLQVNDEYGITGAEVYIDNKKVGVIPYTSKERLAVGAHTLTVMFGELYKPYTTTINVEKGITAQFAPKLESNAAETTLQVDCDAEIYIDGKLLGKQKWTGPIKAGKYSVECRLANHESSFKTITIIADESQVIQLDSPKPITGYIAINSSPLDAEVKLDGQVVGTTPMTLPDVLIGQHQLTLSLPNHKTEERTVTVEKDKTIEINVNLSTIAKMNIASTPPDAKLYLNGKYMGQTPYSKEMASGDYEVKIVKRGFYTFSQNVHLDSSNPEQTIKLQRQYQKPHNLYFGATFSAPTMMAVGANIGGYIFNVNLEVSYDYGLSNSEMFYWNDVSTSPSEPKTETYTAQFIGGKLGYGIIFKPRFRITPQIGIGSLMASGELSKCHAIICSACVRGEIAIINHLGVSVTPEYRFPVKKSETFDKISLISSKVKGWSSGFNCAIGLYCYF